MSWIIRVPIEIVTCSEWGARQPSEPITVSKRATRVIQHHTAGHHPEIANPANESEAEAMAYARAIQDFHMDVRGWIDSGHNFLVCRNGMILQGRWLTVSKIQAGKMVVSAHCPSQNTNIGVEHEHQGSEPMTRKQFDSSARLIAWASGQYGRVAVLPVSPHSKYLATDCPANLKADIPTLVRKAQTILDRYL